MSAARQSARYKTVRLVLGLYLAIHYLRLIPWGAELFSSTGEIADARLSPLMRAFPNVLAIFDSPSEIRVCLIACAGLSVLLATGVWDRLAALLLWYFGACLLGRNPLIANPALPYVGWLLLAHVFVSSTATGTLPDGSPSRTERRIPREVYAIAWILLGLGYSYSGVMKLGSPSWIDGSAVARILQNPLARPNVIRWFLLSLPPIFLKLATWGSLGVELSFGPLALIRRARPWIWAAMVALHLTLLLVLSFPELTAGMLLIHAFTFDPQWVGNWRRVKTRVQNETFASPSAA